MPAHVAVNGGLEIGEMADVVRLGRIDTPLSKAHLKRDRERGSGECWGKGGETAAQGGKARTSFRDSLPGWTLRTRRTGSEARVLASTADSGGARYTSEGKVRGNGGKWRRLPAHGRGTRCSRKGGRGRRGGWRRRRGALLHRGGDSRSAWTVAKAGSVRPSRGTGVRRAEVDTCSSR